MSKTKESLFHTQ